MRHLLKHRDQPSKQKYSAATQIDHKARSRDRTATTTKLLAKLITVAH